MPTSFTESLRYTEKRTHRTNSCNMQVYTYAWMKKLLRRFYSFKWFFRFLFLESFFYYFLVGQLFNYRPTKLLGKQFYSRILFCGLNKSLYLSKTFFH